MKFAKVVFLVAGIYGLIVLLPLYFMEAQTGRDYPPPITHPEYYYGFIGVAVAWQLVFLPGRNKTDGQKYFRLVSISPALVRRRVVRGS